MLTKTEYRKLFDSFSSQKVMIIGDVMIDSYLFGKVERISPEAPVPVVSVNYRSNRLGGAANVALNINSMGAIPILCSVIGNDEKSDIFIKLLEMDNLPVQGIIKSKKRITTTKFRIIGNNTQMLRVDEETESDLEIDDRKELLERIKSILENEEINVIVFQDYDKGILGQEVINTIIDLAHKFKIPVVVDPKKKNFKAYKNITLFKPNLKELKEGLNLELSEIENLSCAIEQLHKNQNIEIILTTLSEAGVFISYKSNDNTFINNLIPAHIRSIADVSGAGDTVIGLASLCLASKIPYPELAKISNLAGGIVCEEVGVVPINREKLLNELVGGVE
ncbi:MAG: hypothetical protein JEY97_06875 [Bacteroidales bacterium]|nr:hypothetical protein [Bacteroidales bacterium]